MHGFPVTGDEKKGSRLADRCAVRGFKDWMTLSPRAVPCSVRPLIGGGEKRPLDGQFDEASFTIDAIIRFRVIIGGN